MDSLHLLGKITCSNTYNHLFSKGLKLVPSKQTQRLLQREELWLHKEERSVGIYAKKEKLFEDNMPSLLFWIEVTDPQFYNYTHLPKTIANKDHILCFTNDKEEASLTVKKEIIKNVQRKIQVVVFDETVVKDECIKVYDLAGNMVYEEVVMVGTKSAVLDLTQEEDGLYTWTFDGFSGTFFLTDKNLKRIVGVFMFMMQSEKVHRINIQFEAKKTYWEYLIISKKEITENAYKIIDDNANYTFSYQGKVTVLEAEAVSFISDQEIPYQEYPKTLFKLIPNIDSAMPYFILEERVLPNASPENIKIHKTAETTAFKTQIILYI